MKLIDLRSDTVTLPSQAMRDAMYKAEVGDDVYGEDPTVNRLQELAAERLGKEAGLFVASGTMGNLVAMLSHCGRGNEIIVGDRSHIVLHEQGGPAALGGIFTRMLRNKDDGTICVNEIKAVINQDEGDDHLTRTKLICLENTWNGRVLKPEYMAEVGALARQRNLKMHLDGARLFNACVALDSSPAKVTKEFDSVQFCFSKGLSAPVGSMVCGTKAFIHEVKRNRKLVGGGWRQAGIIAAACIVAMDQMVERLAEDHANARLLADGIAQCKGIQLDPTSVDTNIVIFGFDETLGTSPEQFTELVAREGLQVMPLDHQTVRAVTHYGIDRADIERSIKIIQNAISNGKMAVSLAGSKKGQA
jgi:threonine aldolase